MYHILLTVRVLPCSELNKTYLNNKIKIKYLETYYLELVEYYLSCFSPSNPEIFNSSLSKFLHLNKSIRLTESFPFGLFMAQF